MTSLYQERCTKAACSLGSQNSIISRYRHMTASLIIERLVDVVTDHNSDGGIAPSVTLLNVEQLGMSHTDMTRELWRLRLH